VTGAARRKLALGALAVTSIGASGCGGDSAPRQDILDRLPAESDTIQYLDAATFREQLGLPPDATPDTSGGEEAEAIESLRDAMAFVPRGGSATDAPVDMGQVQSAAQGLSVAQGADVPIITVIETEQPFDEIAARLEEGSYTRDGSVLDDRLGDDVVADAGNGVVPFGHDAEPPAGEVRLTTAETADAESLFEPSLLPAIESGEPTADGSVLTVPFELSDNPLPLSADAVLKSFEGAYDCG
jgi:hypothetical protein